MGGHGVNFTKPFIACGSVPIALKSCALPCTGSVQRFSCIGDFMSVRPPTDTRKQREQLNRSLFVLVLCVLVVGGAVGIGVFYGSSAGLLGLACLLGGAGLLGLLWGIFTLLGRWANPQDE